MNTLRSSRHHLRLLAPVAVAILLLAGSGRTAAAVTPTVTITDLGTLGGVSSVARSVSENGQVVGESRIATGEFHAFSWTRAGGMVDLGALGGLSSSAWDVNSSGQVVGGVTFSFGPGMQARAFSWTQAGGMVDLGTLGGRFSSAASVSETGQVVGSSTTPSPGSQEHAFAWTASGGMVDLGTLGGTSSVAFDVNVHGMVVGRSTTAGGQTHGFVWTQADGMVDLGTLGGTQSQAFHVNDAGMVVGYGTNATGQLRGFVWTKARGMVDLGTLGGTHTVTGGLNAAGRVVGGSTVADGTMHAFVWTEAGGMVDLGTYKGNPTSAGAINASGQIVGGHTPPNGQGLGLVWMPGGGVVELATLGGPSSSRFDLNDAGQIVGTATTASGLGHATLWELGPSDTTPPNPPTLTADRAPEYAGGLGWHKDTVTVSFAGNGDPDGPERAASGVDPASVPAPVTFTTTGQHSASGTVKDLAGNESPPASLDVRVDATDPALSFVLRKADGSFYTPGTWSNQPVTVTVGCTDEGAGVASVTPTVVTLAGDGAGQFVRATCVDRVGHSVTRLIGGIKIDRTPPELEASFDPAGNGAKVRGRDAGSGVPANALAPDPPAPAPGRAFKARQTYTVADAAGNRVVAVLDVKGNGGALEASFVSLRYGDGPTVATPNGELTFSWQLTPGGSLGRLLQRVRTHGTTTAQFSAADGTTAITTAGGERTTHAGLVLLRAVTNAGAVELAPLP
jgi:probable HAF family extracellular repeat protein